MRTSPLRSAPRRAVLEPPLAAVAGQRAVAYRLFGQCLLPPQANRVAAIAAAVRELSDAQAFADFACHQAWERFLREAGGYIRQDPDARMAAYVRRFDVSNQAAPIPLTEATAQMAAPEDGAAVADALALEYAAAGLRPAPHISQPADHAAVELEFMAMLCDQESAAWRQGQVAVTRQRLRRQRRFLHQHVMTLLPLLAGRLRVHAPDSFQEIVAVCAGEFAIHDADFTSVLISNFDGAGPHDST